MASARKQAREKAKAVHAAERQAAQAEKKPRTRRAKKSPALLRRICDHLARGKTLADFVRINPDSPARETLDRWKRQDPEWAAAMREARDVGFDELAEGLLDAVDTPHDELPRDNNGRIDNGYVQLMRLRADTVMKLLAVWSARYGEKSTVRVEGELQHQHTHEEISHSTPADLAARALAIYERAQRRIQAEDADAEPKQIAAPKDAEFEIQDEQEPF